MGDRVCRGTVARPWQPAAVLPDCVTGLHRQLQIFGAVSRRATSARSEMALRLARLSGDSPEFWLNAQRSVDLWDAAQNVGKDVRRIKPLRVAWSILAMETVDCSAEGLRHRTAGGDLDRLKETRNSARETTPRPPTPPEGDQRKAQPNRQITRAPELLLASLDHVIGVRIPASQQLKSF